MDRHELHTHVSGAGLAIGECTCGEWEMKVGPDALVGQARTLEDVLRQVHALHREEEAPPA